jgi:hypothetical protein
MGGSRRRGRNESRRRGGCTEVLREQRLVELEVVIILDIFGSFLSPEPLPLQDHRAQLVHGCSLE